MTTRITPSREVSLLDLPKSIQQIIAVVGMDSALKIVQSYGGGAVYVPIKPEPQHPLSDLLGFKALCQLVSVYGGEHLPIPRCLKAIIGVRNQKILSEFLAGKSQRKLAYQYNLTERTINTIVHSVRLRDDTTGSLF